MKIKRFNELFESNSTAENKVETFKEYWREHYSFIAMELTDEEITEFIKRTNSISRATDIAVDYLLANGLAEVME